MLPKRADVAPANVVMPASLTSADGEVMPFTKIETPLKMSDFCCACRLLASNCSLSFVFLSAIYLDQPPNT